MPALNKVAFNSAFQSICWFCLSKQLTVLPLKAIDGMCDAGPSSSSPLAPCMNRKSITIHPWSLFAISCTVASPANFQECLKASKLQSELAHLCIQLKPVSKQYKAN